MFLYHICEGFILECMVERCPYCVGLGAREFFASDAEANLYSEVVNADYGQLVSFIDMLSAELYSPAVEYGVLDNVLTDETILLALLEKLDKNYSLLTCMSVALHDNAGVDVLQHVLDKSGIYLDEYHRNVCVELLLVSDVSDDIKIFVKSFV